MLSKRAARFTLAALLLSFCAPQAALAEKFEVRKTQIGESYRQYLVDLARCRFIVGVSDGSAAQAKQLKLDIPISCNQTAAEQIKVFRRMLRVVAQDQGGLGSFRNVGLPRIDSTADFLGQVAAAAHRSEQWKIAIKGKTAGASVNKEVFDLLTESSAYADFEELLREFGVSLRLDSVEKAFLTKVAQLSKRGDQASQFANLPGEFLVPGTALARFKATQGETKL